MDAEEQIGEWQESTGLSDSGGDPSGVTPDHLATLIREQENEIRYLQNVNTILLDAISDSMRKVSLLPKPERTIPEF